MSKPINPGVVYLPITLIFKLYSNYISNNSDVSGGFSRNSHFLYLWVNIVLWVICLIDLLIMQLSSAHF